MANTRKLHYKDINATASTYTGDLGNIWFDPETNVLRTYTGSPGGKLIGDGTGAASTTGTFAAGTLAGSYYSLYNDGVGYDTYISSKNNDGEVGILSHESAFIKTSWNDADTTWTFGTDGNLTIPHGGKLGFDLLAEHEYGAIALQSLGGVGTYAAIASPYSFVQVRDNEVEIQSRIDGETIYNWTFGADGKLTFPTDGSIDTYSGTGGFKITTDGQIQFASGYSIGGSDTGLGLRMATDRGTILFGNHPEVGSTTHFHIMKQDPYHVDLFLGDDLNYVKLKGNENIPPSQPYGVEIGTNDSNGGSQNIWRFGTDGTLTTPTTYPKSYELIVPQTTGTGDSHWTIELINSLSPVSLTFVDGGAGNNDGDVLTILGSQFGGTDGIDNISITVNTTSYGSWGGIISTYTVNTSPLPTIAIPTVQNTNNITVRSNNNDWTFGTDGTLTLPKGLQTSSSETLNLFTNYSSGNINIGGISPTINMGGQVNIGYLNTRIVFGYSGVLTAGTSFTNFTGTPASNGTWTTAIATGTNGNGGPQNGVPVSFTVHGAFGVYNSVEPNFYGQGQNYAVGDTITIAGTQLGGTSPANDLTFTIAGEVGNTYPNLGPGSLVFDYGLGQFFGYTQNTYGTQAYPLWRRLDNTSASSLVNGSYTVSLGTAGTLNLPNFGSTPGAGDGSIGDIARDGDILYFKTSTGWKTVTLGV